LDIGLKDKVIMVGAASRGLGFGIARACAADGAKLSIASPNQENIEAAASRLREETGAEVLASVFNASDAESIERWTQSTMNQFGCVDGLLVNAGGPPTGKFDSFDDDSWQAAYELTLLGSIRMIRSVLPSMRERGGGSIVTLTSSSIKEPIDVLLLSNVMRAGVVALAKSLSRELAADGIRVNNLVPGRMDTDRVRSIDAGVAQKSGKDVETVRQQSQSAIPLGRYGGADEFGKAGAFLLSDAASYITGSTLTVDGGAMKTVW
jgi:3-oxoacyl-[acyl-carrier protein] reductase